MKEHPKYLKVSNYRPNQIIARDPRESTYECGDDKFPSIFFINDIELGKEICRRYNEHSREYEAALKTIASYDKNSKFGAGICDYGCDCPNIAQKALNNL